MGRRGVWEGDVTPRQAFQAEGTASAKVLGLERARMFEDTEGSLGLSHSET